MEPKSNEKKAELNVETGTDELIHDMKDLMSVLDFIVFTMKEQRYHTDDECKTFENACKYRRDTLYTYKLSPICKLHINSLEKHVPWFMKTYRRLFGKDNIECFHASNNNYNRALKSIRVWEK